MYSLNKVTIIGRLGDNPDVRNTQDGRVIVGLKVATSEAWKDKKTGEKKEKTEWHVVSILNEGLAKVASSYLKKGSKVYLEGQLQTRKWQDKEGQDRYTTEIVLGVYGGQLILLDSAGGEARETKPQKPAFKPRQKEYVAKTSFQEDLDDDIPF